MNDYENAIKILDHISCFDCDSCPCRGYCTPSMEKKPCEETIELSKKLISEKIAS